jgi:hypothetical protein
MRVGVDHLCYYEPPDRFILIVNFVQLDPTGMGARKVAMRHMVFPSGEIVAWEYSFSARAAKRKTGSGQTRSVQMSRTSKISTPSGYWERIIIRGLRKHLRRTPRLQNSSPKGPTS